jgi:hypothetical protein
MPARKMLIAICVANSILLAAMAANAGEVIEFSDLPAAVRKSVKALFPDMAPGDFQADRQSRDVYEIGYSRKGIYYLVTVDADGTVGRIQEKSVYKPLPASRRNDRIAEAASLNEDIIEMALAGDATGVAGKIADLKQSLPTLRPYIGDDVYGDVEGPLKTMETKDAKGDLMGVSFAAVDAYKQLILSLDQTVMVAPIEVSLLDYSGFKLLILSHAERPDWAEIAAAIREERGYWKSLEGRIEDSDLRDLMGSMQSGLDAAAGRKDRPRFGRFTRAIFPEHL